MTPMQWARVLRAGAVVAGTRPDQPLTTSVLAEILASMSRRAFDLHAGTAVDGHPQHERPYTGNWNNPAADHVCVRPLPIVQGGDCGATIDVPAGWHLVQVLPDLKTQDDMIMCLVEPCEPAIAC